MKNKFLLLGMVFLLVAGMISASSLMSSCSNNSTSTVSTTKATTAASGTPIYGGTLTVATDWMFEDPGGFDAGLTSMDFDASTTIWEFFKEQSLQS